MGEAELLRAIWDEPHDDDHRLVFADFLDRDGDAARSARADFIRVQCALARGTLSTEDKLAAERRERHLWQEHRKAFRHGLPDLLRGEKFARGFCAPNMSAITGHKLAEVIHDLLPLAPLWSIGVRSIMGPQLSTWFASKNFERVERIHVDHGTNLDHLARSPHAVNLVAIDWPYSAAPSHIVQLLGALPRLRELRLHQARIGEHPELVPAADFAPYLEVLDIRANDLRATAPQVLFASGRFARLHFLDLSYQSSGDALVVDFAVNAVLPALASLRLAQMKLTTVGAHALAGWTGGRSLRHLDVSYNAQIGEHGVRALVESPHLTGLDELFVTVTDRTRDAIHELLHARFGKVVQHDWALRGTRL